MPLYFEFVPTCSMDVFQLLTERESTIARQAALLRECEERLTTDRNLLKILVERRQMAPLQEGIGEIESLLARLKESR